MFWRTASRNLSRSIIYNPRPMTIYSGLSQRFTLPTFRAATYATSSGLSNDDIQGRILDVMKSFEKVDPLKLESASRFKEDLGLDSLDAVEVVMAIEEEFAIEIPDAEADEISTVQQAIEYIAKTPEGQLLSFVNAKKSLTPD